MNSIRRRIKSDRVEKGRLDGNIGELGGPGQCQRKVGQAFQPDVRLESLTYMVDVTNVSSINGGQLSRNDARLFRWLCRLFFITLRSRS